MSIENFNRRTTGEGRRCLLRTQSCQYAQSKPVVETLGSSDQPDNCRCLLSYCTPHPVDSVTGVCIEILKDTDKPVEKPLPGSVFDIASRSQ